MTSADQPSQQGADTSRLFFALWPDDIARAALLQLQTRMHGRPTPYQNLHLTLAFLGQQPVALLPELTEMLRRLPRANIPLILDRIGYFTRKRIVWAGPHAAPDTLFTLQDALTTMLSQRNILPDSGQFRPHVTLARNAEQPEDAPFEPIIWHADHLALVKSVTAPEGPVYEVLASRSLLKDVRVKEVTGNEESADLLANR